MEILGKIIVLLLGVGIIISIISAAFGNSKGIKSTNKGFITTFLGSWHNWR